MMMARRAEQYKAEALFKFSTDSWNIKGIALKRHQRNYKRTHYNFYILCKIVKVGGRQFTILQFMNNIHQARSCLYASTQLNPHYFDQKKISKKNVV